MNKRERIVGWGAIVLLIGAFGAGLAVSPETYRSLDPSLKMLVRFSTSQNRLVKLEDSSRLLQSRDPVLLQNPDGTWIQVGYIRSVDQTDSLSTVEVLWFAREPVPDECRFVAYRNHGRLEDAIELLFPPEKQQRIRALMMDAMQTHGDAIAARILPIMEKAIRGSLPVIESGLQRSFSKHRVEIDRLADRWKEDVVTQRLVPMARNAIAPIVRKHAEPVAQSIGRELWDRASIWGFTWRAIYDKSPLPQKDLMKQEWDRFVAEEAIPVLNSHSDEIAGAIQRTMVDISQNRQVRQELGAAADLIANDPAARKLITQILSESIIDNQELRDQWAAVWSSDEARNAIASAGESLEPTLRKIGDEIMGSRKTGIDPGFARLLRSQVLQKDQRWLEAQPVAVADQQPQKAIQLATDRKLYPAALFAEDSGD